MEGWRADLGVGSISGHGRLHLHVAAFRGAQRQAGQVFDGGVRVLAVQGAAAHRRRVLQLCKCRGSREEAEVKNIQLRGVSRRKEGVVNNNDYSVAKMFVHYLFC